MPFIATAVAFVEAAIANVATDALIAVGVNFWTAISVGEWVAEAVVAAAAIEAASLFAPKPQAMNQGQELQVKLDPTMPRQVITGIQSTGGSVVWAFTYTDDSNPNKYLVRIISLADYPCTGFVGMYTGGQILTFSGDITTGWYDCLEFRDPENDHPARMWARVYLGSLEGAVADASVVGWSNNTWTANAVGTGQCYVILKYQYGGAAFPGGEPQLQFVVKGAAIYDQRQDSTRGGGRTGNQRLADPTTWAYSSNAAVVAQQVLRGFYVGGRLILGGGASDLDLDDEMLVAAYNTCDTAVAAPGGTTEPQYQAHMLLTASEALSQQLTDLQAAMDGTIYDRGGNITIWPGGGRTPIFNLTDDDIVWSDEKSWQSLTDLNSLYNSVIGTYLDATQLYTETPFPLLTSAQWELDDGGSRIPLQIAYRAVTSASQVQRINTAVWNRSRYQGVTGFVIPMWGLQLEQGDWFTLTSSRWGFNEKVFVATQVNIGSNLRSSVIATEISADIDGWNPATQYVPPPFLASSLSVYTLPEPTLAVSSGTNNNATLYTSTVYITVAASGIDASSGVTEIQIEMGVVGSGITWNPHSMSITGTLSTQINDGLLPGTQYQVRIRSAEGDRYSVWTAWQTTTTPSASSVMDSGSLGGVSAATWSASLAAAQTAADNAVSDGILTIAEKQNSIIPLITELQEEYTNGIVVTAGTLGVSTTTYVADMQTLNTFLATLVNPVNWNNVSNNTIITFPANFQAYINAAVTDLQALRSAVTAKAATLATAAGTTYNNGQTVQSLQPAQTGADVTGDNIAAAIFNQGQLATSGLTNVQVNNGLVTGAGNAALDSEFVFVAKFWQRQPNTTGATLSVSSQTMDGGQTIALTGQLLGAPAANSYFEMAQLPILMSVTPGQLVELSAYVDGSSFAAGDTINLVVDNYGAAGASAYTNTTIIATMNPTSLQTSIVNMQRIGGFYTVPTGVYCIGLGVRAVFHSNPQAGPIMRLVKPMLRAATSASQTTLSPYMPSQIAQWGADITNQNIAAGITGQGALATATLTTGQVVNTAVPAGGVNRISFSLFERNYAGGLGIYVTTPPEGWVLTYNPQSLTPVWGVVQGSGYTYLQVGGVNSTGNQTGNPPDSFTVGQAFKYLFPVNPGEWVLISCQVGGWNASFSPFLELYDVTGTYIENAGANPANGGMVSGGFPIGDAWLFQIPTSVTVSGTTHVPKFATFNVYVVAAAAGSYGVQIGEPFVCGVQAGQTAFPAFNPGPNAIPGADITGQNVAEAVNGQGQLATLNSVGPGQIVAGTLAGDLVRLIVQSLVPDQFAHGGCCITCDLAPLYNTSGSMIAFRSVSCFAYYDDGQGAGGWDTTGPTLSGTAWIYVYLISDGTNISAMLSLNAVAPSLPTSAASYVYHSRVGAVFALGANWGNLGVNILPTIQRGRHAQIINNGGTIGSGGSTNMFQLAHGGAGNTTTPTWLACAAVGVACPSTAVSIDLQLTCPVGNIAAAAPNNNYGCSQNAPPYACVGVSGATGLMTLKFAMPLETSNVYYISSSGNASLLGCGWEDNVAA
jgi:hypothetical protein